MSGSIKKAWEARSQILEGLKNSLFLDDKIEEIADERMAICKKCPNLDTKGTDCLLPGTQPCCKLCGCCMALKTRVLSAKCDDDKWFAVLSQEEEDNLNQPEHD
jgi:hypothetical protein